MPSGPLLGHAHEPVQYGGHDNVETHVHKEKANVSPVIGEIDAQLRQEGVIRLNRTDLAA